MFYKKKNIKEFNNILSFATSILNSSNPKRIYEVMYSLGKPYQFKLINDLLKDNTVSNNALAIEHLFLKKSKDNYRFILTNENNEIINYSTHIGNRVVHPSETLILALPWNIDRLYNAFQNIGRNVGVPWENDDLNHRVIYISPINIGYIFGGNHSTVINIINNEASMKITEDLDLTPVYNKIYTDGRFFYNKQTNKIIDEVASVEFAAIFEIGRLILQRDI
ncbi:DUF6710 family protein [Sutcliffiella cohnii]|uniref:DUF6710 family protein n=1 Tax=Sutcliffiella cohnii TaxID=33932 RepID=UPI000834B7AE|nr:DUF6710 family protein [Sutcliffiella cohnii]